MIIDEDVYLEHHGIKGMHWGIRRQQRLDRANRVASGKASRSERASFVLTETSLLSLARNRGNIQRTAQNRASELKARKKRILAGEASARDFMSLHGGDRLFITGSPGNSGSGKSSRSSRSEIDRSMRATLKERKRLKATGALSKDAARAGTVRFGRNMAVAMLAGGLAGLAAGKLITG